MAVYNEIGDKYNSTRKADPYIAGRLYELLAPSKDGVYLDIGCGTGNYLRALSEKGINIYGVDPSELMLERARQQNPGAILIQSTAEEIPLDNNYFDGGVAVLTLHHWPDAVKGLKGVHRVLKPDSRLVFFSYTPEQMKGYWLYHYFPIMIDRAMKLIPGISGMRDILHKSGFELTGMEKYFVREDLEDHFMYSHKSRPEMYLIDQIRDNSSGFRLLSDPDEMKMGLNALREDIETGAIASIIDHYVNDLGDYLFLVARRK